VTGEVKRLHLGCGLNTPEGWIHLDRSWNARLAKHPFWRKIMKTFHFLPEDRKDIPWRPDILIHDLRRTLPFGDESIHSIYSSHVLEHLYLQEAKALLEECVRVLVPGGVLRVVVPDLRSIISEYIGDRALGKGSKDIEMMNPADRLNRRLMFRSPEPRAGNVFLRIYFSLTDVHSHKWMYDADSLIFYFEQAGLVNVREMQFLHSQIENIEKIEKGESLLNGEGICVEGLKTS
jgi:predicted SAM-dependent methyltransferase